MPTDVFDNFAANRPVVQPEHVEALKTDYGYLLVGVDYFEMPLGASDWFGLGALRNQRILSRLSIPKSPLISADPITPGLGGTGFLGIVEPFFFSSDGLGVFVETDQLIHFSLNAPTQDVPKGFDRPYVVKDLGVPTDGLLKIWGKGLRIRLYRLGNARDVVTQFHAGLHKSPVPPLHLFQKPLWTTWANFKNDISQRKISEYVQAMRKHELPCSILGIDAKWQKEFGDTTFDERKFPNPELLVQELHQLGVEVTLWNVPFFNRTSENFERAIADKVVLRSKADDSPYIGKWWEGEAAFLDLTRPEALEWHLNNLRDLARRYELDGFKFDAGEAGFYMDEGIAGANPIAPQSAGRSYIQKIGELFPWSDARTGSRTQHVPILLRQWDKNTSWGFRNGLASAISQTVTLSLLGYRFTFPDMIAGNEYGNERADFELMVRWVQAVAPLPFIQFSIPPWRYGRECVEVCKKYLTLHADFASISHAAALKGEMIVKPLWWNAPDDHIALGCEDQYLITDSYLVAPVIEPGKESRDVYLPAGTWQSYWNHEECFQGGAWLKDFPASLDVLPLFKKIS